MLHAPAVSPNDKLRLAASKGHTDKVLELIEGGASCDADRQGRTALHFAAHYGFSDTVAALILTGCDVNAPDFSGHTALQRAAAEGHVAIVQQLVKHGARVDHQDDIHGNTALHEAAWKGYSQTIEALCKAKANVYIKNKGGFAPLHLACQNGHNQSCRVLLITGCRPDIKNNYGDTPLHTAARYGHAGVIRILISATCNVSEQNKNDDTALHISSAMGRRKLTRILLEAGCDQSLRNKQGEKASDIAKRKDFGEVTDILQNPPPRRPLTSGGAANGERAPEVSKKSHKKRDKESGTSKDSKDSGSRHKSKHKSKKSKHGHRVHFKHGSSKAHQEPLSPYGCHHSSKIMSSSFPTTNLDSLPKEPLKKGEQYYLDLAGNIRKGPVGVGYACYCAPFFRHVEAKMENDKQELMEHIDLAHDDLNAKISNLERRTRAQLRTIDQGVRERLAGDKAECLEKVERVSTRERAGRQRLEDELKTWLRARVEGHPSDCGSTEDSEGSEEDSEEEEDENEGGGGGGGGDRFLKAFRRSNVQPRPRRSDRARLSRSKSEEVISERNDGPAGNGSGALRVLGRRSGPFGRSHEGHLGQEDRPDKENEPRDYADGNYRCLLSDGHDARKAGIDALSDWKPLATSPVRSPQPVPQPHYQNLAGLHTAVPVVLDGQDHDSGYTTKLHSSFESQSSPRPPSSNGTAANHNQLRLRLLAAEFGEPELAAADRRFLDTVSHETDKWYERRLLSIERRSAAAEDPARCRTDQVREVREIREAVRERTLYAPAKTALSGSGNASSLV